MSTPITTRNVIFDGFTRSGYIAPEERKHEGCAFEYRPMLLEENEKLASESERAEAVKSSHLIAAAVLKHLVSWSEVDKDGKPLSITFENLRRLHPVLLNRMRGIIGGYYASDLSPNAGSDGEKDYLDSLLEGTGASGAAGAIALEEQRKN